MDTLKVLTEARDLIADPEAWMQGEWAATTGQENSRLAWEDDAACFCSGGAVARAQGVNPNSYVHGSVNLGAVALLAHVIAPDTVAECDCGDCIMDVVTEWNDDPETEHADVLRVFDEAINIAEELSHGRH